MLRGFVTRDAWPVAREKANTSRERRANRKNTSREPFVAAGHEKEEFIVEALGHG